MKINNSPPPDALRQVERNNKVNPPGKPAETDKSGQSPASSGVQKAGVSDSQDIDSARVNEIREAIREGRLEIHSDRISDGLINSIRSMLDDK